MFFASKEEQFLKASKHGDLTSIQKLTTPPKKGKNPRISLSNHDNILDEKNKWTALHWASSQGHFDIVQYLLETGNIDPNKAKDIHGNIALHFAAWNNHSKVIQLLLEKGADSNKGNQFGSTALHWAAQNGGLNATQVLLEGGANLNVQTNKGMTPADLAAQFNHHHIAEMLHDASKSNNARGAVQISNLSFVESGIDMDEARELLQETLNHPESTEILNLPPEYIVQCTDNFAKMVGSGSFGKVYFAKDDKLEKNFAVKLFDFSNITNENEKKQLLKSYRKEASTLKRFRHPNIITLYGTSNLSQQQEEEEDSSQINQFALVLEYANKGSLASFLRDDASRARLGEDTRISIMYQIARSIHFLHTGGCGGLAKVLHRDIKPSNICLTDNYQVKLIDCGLAKLEKDANAGVSQLGSVTPTLFTSRFEGPAGTRGYRCPVYDLTNVCVEGSDVFSMGVVFAELVVGCLQGGQSSRNGRVFQLMYDMYVFDRTKNKTVANGHEKLAKDADPAIEWNPDTLKKICKIAVECMAPVVEERKATLNLVDELNDILSQVLTENTDNSVVVASNDNNTTADDNSFAPCSLCNRSLAKQMKCSNGHVICGPCAGEYVLKHLNLADKGSAGCSFCCCVSGCKSEPFTDEELYGVLPFNIYKLYTFQRDHNNFLQDFFSRLETKMDSVSEDVKENKGILKGIANKLTRSVMALGSLTARGAKLCPNLVWMVPTKVEFKKDPYKWLQQKTIAQTYHVVFICQHSWEVAHEPFKITVPQRWVCKVAPLLKFGMFVLQSVAEVNDLPFPGFDTGKFNDKVSAMEEFVDSVLENDDKVLLANANTWVRGQVPGSEEDDMAKGQLSRLLGEGLEMVREKAYRGKRLKLWSEKIIPVPVDGVHSGIKWVKPKYKNSYYNE